MILPKHRLMPSCGALASGVLLLLFVSGAGCKSAGQPAALDSGVLYEVDLPGVEVPNNETVVDGSADMPDAGARDMKSQDVLVSDTPHDVLEMGDTLAVDAWDALASDLADHDVQELALADEVSNSQAEITGADVCTPDCIGKVCGPNGCGGSCGECDCCMICNSDGLCGTCTPDCEGKECGSDGCFHDCGNCEEGFLCEDGKCIEEPPGTEPKIEIVNLPENECPIFQQQLPVNPITVELKFENWEPNPDQGKVVRCFLDGALDGETVSDEYVFVNVPFGKHRLCCVMTDEGKDAGCDKRACTCVRVSKPCSGKDDNGSCDDGNPCAVDVCMEYTEGAQCVYGTLEKPSCCTSMFDCDCTGSKWNLCLEGDCPIDYCWLDKECDDGDKCTIDECTEKGCVSTYMDCD